MFIHIYMYMCIYVCTYNFHGAHGDRGRAIRGAPRLALRPCQRRGHFLDMYNIYIYIYVVYICIFICSIHRYIFVYIICICICTTLTVGRGDVHPPSRLQRESLLDLSRRTVYLRRPDRARKEGSTGPNRLDDTRCFHRPSRLDQFAIFRCRIHLASVTST